MAFGHEILRTFPKADVPTRVCGVAYVAGDEKEDPHRNSEFPRVERESWLGGLSAFVRGGAYVMMCQIITKPTCRPAQKLRPAPLETPMRRRRVTGISMRVSPR